MPTAAEESIVAHLLGSAGFDLQDTAEIEPRPPQFLPVPASLHPRVREVLERRYPNGLYRHQSRSIDAAVSGENIVLATATASGKSLVFMTVAAHMITCTKNTRVLVFYPARALIQDQLGKWREALEPHGIRFTYIDGGIPVSERLERLERAQVAILTPDVAHAWLMRNLHESAISQFLNQLGLLVLDEAHVYDGAFGTNMAFLMRRLAVASGEHQLICSTATVGAPANFVELLTGRESVAFGAEEDGSPTPGKTILRATTSQRPFDATVQFLGGLATSDSGHFLAFADSRKAVEQFVSATLRAGAEEDASAYETVNSESVVVDDQDVMAAAERHQITGPGGSVLPYRAGYEAEDRTQIQESLALGELAGVVATSALELGLDIGDITIVVLLDVPPSVKSFWQRIGRAGRRSHAICVILDPWNSLAGETSSLGSYLARPPEPNWLYLENRYIQYAHALCAVLELSELGFDSADLEAFRSLPRGFTELLDNELHPHTLVPMDLYPLKQRGQYDPHHEFAIRGGVEQEFQVLAPEGAQLGRMSYVQALREAYPGAVYYYMATPYRVWRLDHHRSEIRVRRERRYTTNPISQTMVFPRFSGGIHYLRRSESGFVAEVEMQVSERVLGFVERRGSSRTQYEYGVGSEYAQRPLTRFFETTGVCWILPTPGRLSEQAVQELLETFAMRFGVQERDLGIGIFHAQGSPLGVETVQGACIYDATAGSLRLTHRLAESFYEVVDAARDNVRARNDSELLPQFDDFSEAAVTLGEGAVSELEMVTETTDGDWASIVAPGETAVLVNLEGTREVTVVGYRYTPRGLLYELRHGVDTVTWMTPANTVRPVHGQTKLVRVNLVTGEFMELT
jgi:DEAD/DEAH box helicase domain-containing protein